MRISSTVHKFWNTFIILVINCEFVKFLVSFATVILMLQLKLFYHQMLIFQLLQLISLWSSSIKVMLTNSLTIIIRIPIITLMLIQSKYTNQNWSNLTFADSAENVFSIEYGSSNNNWWVKKITTTVLAVLRQVEIECKKYVALGNF